MRALTWQGRHDVRVDTVPDPEIVNPRDAILKAFGTKRRSPGADGRAQPKELSGR